MSCKFNNDKSSNSINSTRSTNLASSASPTRSINSVGSDNPIVYYDFNNTKIAPFLTKYLNQDVIRIVLTYFGAHDLYCFSYKPTKKFLLVIESSTLTLMSFIGSLKNLLYTNSLNYAINFVHYSFNSKKHLFLITINNDSDSTLGFNDLDIFIQKPFCEPKQFALLIAEQLLTVCDFSRLAITEATTDIFARTWINVIGCCGYKNFTSITCNQHEHWTTGTEMFSEYWKTCACENYYSQSLDNYGSKTCVNLCRRYAYGCSRYMHNYCRDANNQKCGYLQECQCNCKGCNGNQSEDNQNDGDYHCHDRERGCFASWTFDTHVPFLKHE